ncbi:molybdate ABC transporter substrate-binding protein [Paenibacillus herberti]|nr:molybdate ABC transporter substrate-binding protein [Paenibacillus herberti]
MAVKQTRRNKPGYSMYVAALLVMLLLLIAGCGATDSSSNNATAGEPTASPADSASVGNTTTDGGNANTTVPTTPPDEPTELVELTVSAAASLTEALGEIETKFEMANPSIEINYNFGASGTLQKQIEQGASADLFFSASSKNMDALIAKDLVSKDQSINLLANTLVLVAGKDHSGTLDKLDKLKKDSYSYIAVGIPESVPAGQYAKQALEAARLWTELEKKLVQAKDVKSVLQMVETGNAEAGFVYKTDAQSSDKSKIIMEIDPASYSPILYPAAVLSSTSHPVQATAFYDYLRSSEALDVFLSFGFTAAP